MCVCVCVLVLCEEAMHVSHTPTHFSLSLVFIYTSLNLMLLTNPCSDSYRITFTSKNKSFLIFWEIHFFYESWFLD